MIFMLAVQFDKCQMWNIFRISSYFFIIKSREGKEKKLSCSLSSQKRTV